ncbi:hypothetical protein MIR68_004273 [Amoeboaphelidium protococcarum]|nr:hypothetical protein MIR68_004273 [Amoeboaphelidium protococcarum]
MEYSGTITPWDSVSVVQNKTLQHMSRNDQSYQPNRYREQALTGGRNQSDAIMDEQYEKEEQSLDWVLNTVEQALVDEDLGCQNVVHNDDNVVDDIVALVQDALVEDEDQYIHPPRNQMSTWLPRVTLPSATDRSMNSSAIAAQLTPSEQSSILPRIQQPHHLTEQSTYDHESTFMNIARKYNI